MGRGSSKAGGVGVTGGGGSRDGMPNDATEYYVSGEGMWINQYLRGRGDFGELSDSEKKYIEDLDTATNGKITDETLYRSVDADAIFGNISDTDYENLVQALNYGADSFGKGSYADGIRSKVDSIISKTQGKTITEKGYMSTTTSQSVAEDWGDYTGSTKPIIMEITPSKNTKGVNLSSYDKNVSAGEAQHERLLKRNQSFDVEKIYSKNNSLYVKVKMR